MARQKAQAEYRQVLDLLADDHRAILELFREFADLDEGDERRDRLARQACTELSIHARIEEELFYPAARAVLDDPEVIDEAEVAHTLIDDLVAELREMSPSDAFFEGRFGALGEAVQHHFEQEELEVFTKIEQGQPDWEDLGERMRELRSEIETEFEEEEEEDEDDDLDDDEVHTRDW